MLQRERGRALNVKLGMRERIATSATYKARTAMRFSLSHLLSAKLPLYIVNGYQKSGTTWVSQLLGEALELPFQKNRIPTPRASVLHVHYLHPGNMHNVVVVWRDGRDTLLSWYYHCLFPNDLGGNKVLVERVRTDLRFTDYEDVYSNLPRFLEYSFTRQSSPKFSWADFARSWHGHSEAVHLHYENLKADGVEELRRVVRELTGEELSAERASSIVENFSFSRQSGRRPGEESRSFLRKGVVGDWRNHYSTEAREVFDYYAGRELILLGYEQDRSWLDSRAERR